MLMGNHNIIKLQYARYIYSDLYFVLAAKLCLQRQLSLLSLTSLHMLHKFRDDILWQTISVALIYVYTVH